MQVSKEDISLFQKLIDENRYDFCKLAYIIFPFGQKGHALEYQAPYEWQMDEWRKLSYHLMAPATRYETYRMIISSGNGAAKTAFGAMTILMLMYTQKLKARITANTDPQMKSVVWPEYDIWFNHARFSEHFFEKFGTSIKAKNEKLAETWRVDTFTWNEETPAAISGLHNKGRAVAYVFEEAPGIPANIWSYASGAFTETETIKIHMAFGNSDDPNSKFEQNMTSTQWNARRIDTRTLKHIDQKQIADWLAECGGNENHDDFRVRVRGLPRKTAKDSIISQELVEAALARRKGFDIGQVRHLPVVLTCDPAWTGGDETCIWYRQGFYAKLLEKYRLDKTIGQDHMFTYLRLCEWERKLSADAVFIDQAEGTAVYTLANNAGKSWELFSFANSPNDAADFRDSQYSNLRAQMYYQTEEWLRVGAVLDAERPEWIEDIRKQLSWTKGGRHKVHNKKLAEPKREIKERVGQSPDVADGLILAQARPVFERLPENSSFGEEQMVGSQGFRMPDAPEPNYDTIEPDYKTIY